MMIKKILIGAALCSFMGGFAVAAETTPPAAGAEQTPPADDLADASLDDGAAAGDELFATGFLPVLPFIIGGGALAGAIGGAVGGGGSTPNTLN